MNRGNQIFGGVRLKYPAVYLATAYRNIGPIPIGEYLIYKIFKKTIKIFKYHSTHYMFGPMNSKGNNGTALSLSFDAKEREIFDKAYSKMLDEKSGSRMPITKKRFVQILCMRYLNVNSMESNREIEDIEDGIKAKQALIDELNKSIKADKEIIRRCGNE